MESSDNQNNKDLDFLKIQYQVLSNRQISHNSMMWNAPSLLFVVQSLLWTIALSTEVNPVMRCLMSFVSSMMSFMSLQLFQRYRLMEMADSEQLYSIEQFFVQLEHKKNPQSAKSAVIIHHQMSKRTVITEKGSKSIMGILQKKDFFRKGKLVKIRSFNLWLIAFWVILGLSIVISLYNIYEVIKACGILNFLQG